MRNVEKDQRIQAFLKELTSCRVNNINGNKQIFSNNEPTERILPHIFAFCLYSWQLNNYYSNFFVVLLAVVVVVVVVSCPVHPDYSR